MALIPISIANVCHLTLSEYVLFIISFSDIIVGLIEEEYTASEGESVEVCAILNQIPSRRVVVGLATVDSVTIDMDQIQPQGIHIQVYSYSYCF